MAGEQKGASEQKGLPLHPPRHRLLVRIAQVAIALLGRPAELLVVKPTTRLNRSNHANGPLAPDGGS